MSSLLDIYAFNSDIITPLHWVLATRNPAAMQLIYNSEEHLTLLVPLERSGSRLMWTALMGSFVHSYTVPEGNMFTLFIQFIM